MIDWELVLTNTVASRPRESDASEERQRATRRNSLWQEKPRLVWFDRETLQSQTSFLEFQELLKCLLLQIGQPFIHKQCVLIQFV